MERIDLHLHTTASDGAWPPDRVVRSAAEGGLTLVSITDHDTVASVPEAVEVGRSVGVTVLEGCELSSTHEGSDIHILGYGIDGESPAFRRHTERASGARLDRMAVMVGRLQAQGLDVDLDRVRAIAGEGAVVGRPHLAAALVEAGYARDLDDAFDRWIGDSHPAFVPTRVLAPVDAVETILSSGGVAVWAHPPESLLDELLPALVSAGLGGLEAYRPRNSPELTRRLRTRAEKLGLVCGGGSDWHHPSRNPPLGDFYVTRSEVGDLLERLGLEQ